MNIYEISQEYQQAFTDLSEMDDLPEGCLEDTLSPLKSDLEKCALNIASYLKNKQEESIALRRVEEDIKYKRQRLEKKIKQLADYLKTNLEQCRLIQVTNALHEIRIKNNPPSVEIENEALLPKDFLKEKIETHPDKALIKKSIQDGYDVPGAYLKTSTRLEIK